MVILDVQSTYNKQIYSIYIRGTVAEFENTGSAVEDTLDNTLEKAYRTR